MAEEYTIWLRNGAKRKRKSIAGTTGDNQKDTTPGSDSESRAEKTTKQAAGYVAYKRYISPFIKQAISYEISTVSLRTGKTEYQQRLQFAYDMGSKVVGLAENMITGFLISGGNPIGAVIGAGVSVIQTAVQYAQAQNTLNLENSKESISIGLQNVRAGGSVAATNGSRGGR